jgi:nucleoside 2-deoxyribosyltransferase
MLEVAGGTYLELCGEPAWSELYGSGVRAAASLARLSRRVSLHTYIGKRERPTLDWLSSTFGFGIAAAENINRTISFSYQHPLSEPVITPEVRKIELAAPLIVSGEAVVRFGFLEGDAVVHGRRVVYDPQSRYGPRPFHENGSTAEKLAIVANVAEASQLTGERVVAKMGRRLQRDERANVVVIKRGWRGATVFHASAVMQVPVYPTERVWSIGSGDVFTAVFGHFWAERSLAPRSAAVLASQATAYYCATRSLPVPRSPGLALAQLGSLPPRQPPSRKNPLLYLAGPFFTIAQRWLVTQSYNALLRQGIQVFSPFHDVGVGPADKVVKADLAALRRSTGVFAVIDGADPGTLFEVGFARALGIPVVALVQNESNEAVKMLQGSDCVLLDDFASAIYRATWLATGT